MTECSVDECTREAKVRGFCTKHYQAWRRYGDATKARPYRERGRTKPSERRPLLEVRPIGRSKVAVWALDDAGEWWHYPYGVDTPTRGRAEVRKCEQCGAEFLYRRSTHGDRGLYCSQTCANRATKPLRGRRGADHPSWKGGTTIDSDGYRRVRIDGGYVFEHRVVMAETIGRPLYDYETVHHRNGDKLDNRPENLQLFAGRHGRGASEAHCPTCTCFEHQ